MGVAMLVAAWTGGSISSYIGSVRAKCLTLFLLINQNISIVIVMATIAATTLAAVITPTMGPAPNELVESFTVGSGSVSVIPTLALAERAREGSEGDNVMELVGIREDWTTVLLTTDTDSEGSGQITPT